MPTNNAFAPHRHVKTMGEADYRRRLRDLDIMSGGGRLDGGVDAGRRVEA
jgi:hypothetical protein